MDLVINYQNFYEKRIRDLGTFKYVLRSLEKNANIFDKIYLIYGEDIDILPDWLNKSKFILVKHSDFIPSDFLPTFNPCVVETYLHKIDGLSENFVYLEEDTFFMNKCVPSDFFINDKIVISYSDKPEYNDEDLFNMEVFHSDLMEYVSITRAQKEGREPVNLLVIPENGASPMVKSLNKTMFDYLSDLLNNYNGAFEENKSLGHELFLIGYVKDDKTVTGCKRVFLPLHLLDEQKLETELNNFNGKILMVYEHKICDENQFNTASSVLVSFMDEKFKNKSVYEI